MKISKFNSEGYYDPTTYDAFKNIEKERREAQLAEYKKNHPGFKPLVYVCSPYAGNVDANVRNARRYCRFAVDQNCIPLAPHLLFPQFLNDDDADERSLGMFMGNVLMSKCSEVWVFGDWVSSGMAREIDRAERHNMKVRYFSNACVEVI